jgi:hypothetical protein
MDFPTSEILQSSEIAAKLKQAWRDSEPNVSGGHEEGGFIVIDDFGFLSVVRWEKEHRTKSFCRRIEIVLSAAKQSSRRFTRTRTRARILSKSQV